MDLPTGLLLGGAFLAAWASWVVPNHYPPWITFHGELAMAIAVALVGIWLLWRTRATLTRLPGFAALALLAAAVPLVQSAAGLITFFGDAAVPAAYLVAFALACWFGYAAVAGAGFDRALGPIWSVVVAGAVVSAGLALYQWQGLDYLSYAAIQIAPGARPFANLIQANQLATLLVLGGIGIAALHETGQIGGRCAFGAVAFLGLPLALTQSRAGLLEVAVIGALFAARRRVLSTRLRLGWVLSAVAMVLAFALAWAFVAETGEAGPSPRGLGEMVRPGVRPLHWLTMLDAIGRQPWFGYGWNQVNAAQYTVALDHPASYETLGHSHNLVLDLLVYNGVPTGAALVLGLLAWFWRAGRRIEGTTAVLALAATLAVFVHALVEFPLHYSYFLLPTGFLMGAVSFAAGFRTLSAGRWLAPLLLALSIGAGAVITADYAEIEARVRQMRFEVARVGLNRPPLTPWSSRILTQLEHFWNYAIEREHREMSAGELREAELIVRRFPSKENMLRLAAAYALNGRGPEAPPQLERICRMNPPSACDWARQVWAFKSKQDPEIAAVVWPSIE